jgi:hypothetical protein
MAFNHHEVNSDDIKVVSLLLQGRQSRSVLFKRLTVAAKIDQSYSFLCQNETVIWSLHLDRQPKEPSASQEISFKFSSSKRDSSFLLPAQTLLRVFLLALNAAIVDSSAWSACEIDDICQSQSSSGSPSRIFHNEMPSMLNLPLVLFANVAYSARATTMHRLLDNSNDVHPMLNQLIPSLSTAATILVPEDDQRRSQNYRYQSPELSLAA